jgi:DNA-binding transcriptional MerR regulator
MSLIEIQQLSKMYYSIGEVAEFLNVNTSLLRFWEKEFQFEVSKKNKKGNRLFTVKELEKINKIYQLVKIDGYTLDGAKKALKSKELKPQQEETNQMELVILNLERIKVKLLHLKK